MSSVPPSLRLTWLRLDALPEELLGVVPGTVRRRCLRAVDPVVARRRLAAQAALRLVLAAEVGVPPARLRLVRGPHGKPALADGRLHFNLSDSGGLAVVAVSPEAPVGVDVERVRPLGRWRAVIRRVFGGEAVERLEALPEAGRTPAVMAAWCRYEAWAKARGTGLARAGPPPEGLHLDLPPGGRALPPSTESPSGWWLLDLDAPEGFLAACVVAGAHPPRRVPGRPPAGLPRDVFPVT